jgi:hypothetical protein
MTLPIANSLIIERFVSQRCVPLRPVALMALGLLMFSCGNSGPQHPPEQVNPDVSKSAPAVQTHKSFVNMFDPDVDGYLVADISRPAPGAAWLWTFDHPAVRVWTGAGDPRHLLVKMATVDATMKDTGPVTVTFTVNDHEVGRKTLPKPGSYDFEADVDPAFLKAGDWSEIKMSASPLWTAPADKKHLGFLLIAAGFPK